MTILVTVLGVTGMKPILGVTGMKLRKKMDDETLVRAKKGFTGKTNYLFFASLINLLLAEIAAYQALIAFYKSPLSLLGSRYFPVESLYLVVISIPVLLLLFRKNPFSFGFFYFLILISIGNLLATSELFYAFLDALYAVKFDQLASYLNSIFSPYKEMLILDPLLIVVWLFVLSQMVWLSMEKGRDMEERGMRARNIVFFQWGFAFISTYIIFLLYPYIFGFNFVFADLPLILIGFIGVVLFVLASYLISK